MVIVVLCCTTVIGNDVRSAPVQEGLAVDIGFLIDSVKNWVMVFWSVRSLFRGQISGDCHH